ncbi:MAG: hypothetical protein PVJ78_05190 [Gammaproteobacteria bacterium]|jgi:hypothetical protein
MKESDKFDSQPAGFTVTGRLAKLLLPRKKRLRQEAIDRIREGGDNPEGRPISKLPKQ